MPGVRLWLCVGVPCPSWAVPYAEIASSGSRAPMAGHRSGDDLWLVYTGGTTGASKGVMLSHYNIGSNIAQLEQVFGLTPNDRVLGVLPFFHSFGFTGTLFMPAVIGVGAVYHSNPLDAKTIGPMVKDYRLV